MLKNLMLRNFPFLDPRICNPESGLVSDIFQWLPEPDDPKIYMVAAKMAKKDLAGHVVASDINSAAGLTLREAYTKAIGETIERYSSSFIPDDLILARYRDLERQAADPDTFAFYADEQYQQSDFPFKRFDKNALIRWVEGTDLATGEVTLVPAASVYLPYFFDDNEDKIWVCISTGLAASTNMVDAILRGIYEIVERDAISNMWFNRLSMPQISWWDNPRLSHIMSSRMDVPHVKYHLVNISTDIEIPCIFGVLEEEGRGCLVAAAANANPERAAIKTLIELSQGRISWKTDFVKGVHKEFASDYSDIRDFNTRVELYTKPDMKEKMQFVYLSNEVQSLPNSQLNLEQTPAKLLSNIVSA